MKSRCTIPMAFAFAAICAQARFVYTETNATEVASGKDGSLTVTKTDGTTETVTCKGGVCSDSSGACLNCSD